MTEAVTRGNAFSALKYNVNQMLGWSFGDPTSEEIILYSDTVFISANYAYHNLLGDPSIQYDKAYPDQTFVSIVWNVLTYGNTTYAIKLDNETYQETYGHLDGLIGKYFPWNVVGLKGADGYYYVKRTAEKNIIAVNPMRWECVAIKGMTLIKLFLTCYGTYWAVKLGFKFMRKK